MMSCIKFINRIWKLKKRLWNAKFDNVVIPQKVHTSVCIICANLNNMIKAIRTNDAEKDACQKLLKEHHDN
jgi:hypothetical protein